MDDVGSPLHLWFGTTSDFARGCGVGVTKHCSRPLFAMSPDVWLRWVTTAIGAGGVPVLVAYLSERFPSVLQTGAPKPYNPRLKPWAVFPSPFGPITGRAASSVSRRHADMPIRRYADTPIRRYADTPIPHSPPSVFRPHLFEYRLIPRVVWFEFERSVYRRLGFGNAA